MIDFKEMVKNESVEDILLFLAPSRSLPDIDNMFVRYKFDAVGNGELMRTYARLSKEGKLAHNDKGHAIKGPNWKEPAFVTEKKYGIE